MTPYRRALGYFRPDIFRIILLMLMVACSVALGLLQAWPMAILVDALLTTTPRTDWVHRLFLAPLPSNRVGQIIGIAIIGMVLKICQDSLTLGRAMLNNHIRYSGTARVRRELFTKLEDLGVPYHNARPQGDAIYRLSNDTLGPFGILDTILSTAVATVTLIAMTTVMLSRTVPLTLFALSVAPLLLLINLHFGKKIRFRAAISKQVDADLTTVIQRAMQSIGLILAFGRQLFERMRFDQAVDRSIDASLRLNWQETLYPLFVQLVFAAGGAIVFGYGGYQVYQDQIVHPVPNGLTTGDLMVFMAYLTQLWDPLGLVAGFNARIQGFLAASERVFFVLDQRPLVHDAPAAIHYPLALRELELVDVCFAYPSGPPVLHEICARVSPGEMVAFVGPSGVGKSTLLNLFPRFYDPLSGVVKLDGRDLRDIAISDVRHHIAMVSDETPVFTASISENIAYGCPDATRERIREAAELAGATDFIEKLPAGLETQIGEYGFNLSSGQRLRISIARALLTRAPILILDEPTSALDTKHERMVIRSLERFREKRTVILVTHRLQTVANCDRIYVMNDGRIVEAGRHAELMARGGHYVSLLGDGRG
jgi:subfamily B ATP-binding cassette protein MsbA